MPQVANTPKRDPGASGSGARANSARPPLRRVLYVEANQDGTVGGSHRVLFDLMLKLDRSRYEPVVLFYQDNPYVQRIRDLKIEVQTYESVKAHENRVRRAGSRARKLVDICITPARRFQYLKQNRIDLVHLNNSPLTGYDDWLPAARLLRIPIIANGSGDAAGPQGGWLQKKLFRSYDHYLPCSDYVRSGMLRAKVPANRISLAYPGVDLEAIRSRVRRQPKAVRAELGVGEDTILALMVGNIRHWKGQHVVLAALEKMSPEVRGKLHVAFAGAITEFDRAYMAELRATVTRAGLEKNVSFLGSRDDVPDLLNAADIALHASVKPEPFGLVVIEAMAFGKAVVAACRGGPAEVLDPESGISFDTNDPTALAGTLEDLVGNPHLRSQLGKGALRRVESFTTNLFAKTIHAAYDRVLAKA